jgi:hypothetical protein
MAASHSARVQRHVRIEKPRTVAAATQRRRGRTARARGALLARVCGATFIIVALLMGYVVLTSTFTGLSYAVARNAATREALQEETIRLDDRIAALRSDARLADIAARLGMREPQRFAVVRLQMPQVARVPSRVRILSSLAGFLVPAIAARP